jgi:hypothetical protein
MSLIRDLIDVFFLTSICRRGPGRGALVYLILFAIIFCETGCDHAVFARRFSAVRGRAITAMDGSRSISGLMLSSDRRKGQAANYTSGGDWGRRYFAA